LRTLAFGIVPGDGIHSLWPEVIGSIRGRTFVLTQQTIGAEEAKTLGVISEIVARDRLLDRAREIAGRIAKLPPLTAGYTRVARKCAEKHHARGGQTMERATPAATWSRPAFRNAVVVKSRPPFPAREATAIYPGSLLAEACRPQPG
jgi:enoyl-CoA hydratase/carnithine racemase